MELTDLNLRCMQLIDENVDSQREIGQELGISQQRVSQIVQEMRKEVNKLERNLLIARAGGSGWLLFVPNSVERTLGIAWVQWLVDELRRRGKRVKVEHVPAVNGSGFLLWDETDYDTKGR